MMGAWLGRSLVTIPSPPPPSRSPATAMSCIRAGPVIPLFVEQVREGMADDDHEPRMTRFLMSLDESVALVQYAFEKRGSR